MVSDLQLRQGTDPGPLIIAPPRVGSRFGVPIAFALSPNDVLPIGLSNRHAFGDRDPRGRNYQSQSKINLRSRNILPSH